MATKTCQYPDSILRLNLTKPESLGVEAVEEIRAHVATCSVCQKAQNVIRKELGFVTKKK